MTRYAEKTTVTSADSRTEIEKTLRRYGADQFMYGWEETKAAIGFRLGGRQVRFILPLPNRQDDEIRLTPAKRQNRSPEAQEAAYEQAVKQRWRALALVIKAKLEAVETGITEFDEEFLAHIVLPNGTTVGQFMLPQIDEAYKKGSMPSLLPMLEGPG